MAPSCNIHGGAYVHACGVQDDALEAWGAFHEVLGGGVVGYTHWGGVEGCHGVFQPSDALPQA